MSSRTSLCVLALVLALLRSGAAFGQAAGDDVSARDEAPADSGARADLEQQVRATEHAFAATMADRDLEAFTGFLSEEAVFLSGDHTLSGREEVTAGWGRYFEDEEAPFSWRPERVEVLATGDLALSTGPVLDSGGATIGTFTSIWRREASGRWRIVFDRGCPVCPGP